MLGKIAIMLVACLGLLGTTSCSVLLPTSKVTYVGHSPEDALSAIEEGKVQSVQVNTPANGGAPFALSIDLRDGDHWSLNEQIDDALAVIENFNASAANSERTAVEEIKSYNWSAPRTSGVTPTSVSRSP